MEAGIIPDSGLLHFQNKRKAKGIIYGRCGTLSVKTGHTEEKYEQN